MAIVRTVGDGGAAFPKPDVVRQNADGSDYVSLYGHEGMSLRDYYAGQALVGLMARPEGVVGYRLMPEALAKQCFGVADALIAERTK